MIWALAGCLRAVAPIEGTEPTVWTGRVELAVPAGWEVVRNVKGPLGQHVTLHGPHGDAITVDLLREDRRSRRLPLSVLVDTYAVEQGRSRGIQSQHIAQHHLSVDDREAFATTVERNIGPHTRTASTVGLRGDDVVVFLTLHADSAHAAKAWDTVLGSFDLPQDSEPTDPPFFEDLEMDRRLESGILE